MNLTEEYRSHGISFRYPKAWELTEESQPDAVTVTVTEAGAFWSLTILRRRPRAEQVLREAIEAFEDEYEDVDEYPDDSLLSGVEAQGATLEFVSMELISCVFLFAAEFGGKTLFVMSQVTDHEREEYEPIFEAITASVAVAPDEEIEIE